MRRVETSVLANSGYESKIQQVLIPVKVAELLTLRPQVKGIDGSISRWLEVF